MRYAALIAAALALAACDTFEDDAQRAYTRSNAFTFPAAFTTADARVVTERVNPITGQTVVCTESSPDVAKAISTAFGASGSGSKGGGSVGIGVAGASAEAVAELAGRSTALLGLRDGLFQACQAYANGAIGTDMYALVVSRYSQLMTTLFLGQDIAAVPQPVAVAASPALTVNAGAPSGGSGTSVASVTAAPGTPPASLAGTAPIPPQGAANALVRMNEDYLNLDYNGVHTLMVACMNQSDPTTAMPVDPATGNKYRQRNTWLEPICARLQRLLADRAGLAELASLAIMLRKNDVLPHPVDPAATASNPAPKPASTAAAATKKPAASNKCIALTATAKTQVENSLIWLGYLHDQAITPSNNLSDAIGQFESHQNPKIAPGNCPLGQIGQTTLAALQVIAQTPKPKTP